MLRCYLSQFLNCIYEVVALLMQIVYDEDEYEEENTLTQLFFIEQFIFTIQNNLHNFRYVSSTPLVF